MSMHSNVKAIAATYDRDRQQIIITLDNGLIFVIPYWLCQGLSDATDDELEQVEISPSGLGLHWESLDAGLQVDGLLMGRYGSKEWMNELQSKLNQSS